MTDTVGITTSTTAQSPIDDTRFTVEVPTIDPVVPSVCVGCLAPNCPQSRCLVFRRADGTVERVSAVHWPYCDACLGQLAALDKQQTLMTWTGGAQMLLIVYAVGGALGYYDVWWPSMALLPVLFYAFTRFAQRARQLWALEWARIDDVYKKARGAAYSFRNRAYAELFAAANTTRDPTAP